MSMLFKRIKDWATSITSFRTGDVIPVDGPSGTAKIKTDDLLRVTTDHTVKSSDVQCIDFATNKGFIRADGTIKEDNNWKYSNKIKISENKLSVTLYGYTNVVRSVEFFDSEDNVVGYYIHDAIGMFTIKDMDVPENAVTFRFSMQTTNQQSVSDSSVVLHYKGVDERFDALEGYGTFVQYKDNATNKGFIRADGTIKEDNNWKYSNKIKIGENKLSVTLYGYTNAVRSVEFFDSEDNVVGYYIHDAIGMFTIKDMDVPENAVTFRFSMQTTNQQSVSDSSVVLFTEGIKTISERLDNVESVTKTAREDVFILKTDSEFVIADKMFYAYRKGNCDVHWENGTYEFREVFDYIHTKYEGKNHNELPIGGNCRYYFNGSTLIGHKTSTDEFVVGNSSILGSQRAGGSYELHDGKLTSYGLVYCVHDECNGSTKESRRLYKNMIMDSTPNYENSTTISKCIGGGSGINHVVTIDNCIFNNHNKYNRPDVSYHGHTSSDVIDLVSQFTLNVYNSFFEHYVSLNTLGNNEDAFAVVNNCSFGNNVDNGIEVTDSKWQVKNFMNEIRNSSL